jgi:hypothetical protein
VKIPKDAKRIECEICGSYLNNPKSEDIPQNNICPICCSIGSLFYSTKESE